jgi:hypothetical protein
MLELIVKSSNMEKVKRSFRERVVFERYVRIDDTRHIRMVDFFNGKAWQKDTVVGLDDDFYSDGRYVEITPKEAKKFISGCEYEIINANQRMTTRVGSTKVQTYFF